MRVETAAVEQRLEPGPASGGSARRRTSKLYVMWTRRRSSARRAMRSCGVCGPWQRRCNTYDPARYAPVLVVRGEQVGFVAAQLLNKLRGPGLSAAVEVGPNPLPHVVRRRDDDLDEEVIEDDDVSALAATLAPHAHSVAERTRVVQALVDALVADSRRLLMRPDRARRWLLYLDQESRTSSRTCGRSARL